MKYCPFCGAELLPGALSFCPECGEALPASQASVHGPAAPTQEKRRKRSQKSPAVPEIDSNYDGYYDDVPPVDLGRPRETANSQLVLRVCGLLAVVVLVIAGCAAALFFL